MQPFSTLSTCLGCKRGGGGFGGDCNPTSTPGVKYKITKYTGKIAVYLSCIVTIAWHLHVSQLYSDYYCMAFACPPNR